MLNLREIYEKKSIKKTTLVVPAAVPQVPATIELPPAPKKTYNTTVTKKLPGAVQQSWCKRSRIFTQR